ncbi:DUF4863 family protein [Pseudomonas guariconensis]|uniref:4-hydroxylaminobenzoate lyase n=1 Tax=Pseudomonas TaxID=286 RepID=UPI002096A859|nr:MULTISPECIES: DUF4863 family protein [Pseudomonas]MCO7638754.1 DUF4863 family protein [Pseudomonas sp. S 311-6]MCO7514979.1 DUF4863 family protein [Pseudomonas putida]MCO7564475.1 DUF4863 family protein [Pseudomonas mosselii]MCO7604206.1 DUF4863 family protein [Pseudomonas guariconensis]MCO7615877.1 DUF4863 family protein [Pseudomonas guariconensis]
MKKRDELINACINFLALVKDKTAGTETENWLNAHYGPDSETYRYIAERVIEGVAEGWLANVEISGEHYRRSRLCEPSADTFYFSMTAVYMNSRSHEMNNVDHSFRGDYHRHPYGELNMVIPLDKDAMLAGPQGWQGAGWTAPAPGSQHFPEVKGGALIAFFFLPAGRIAYDVRDNP